MWPLLMMAASTLMSTKAEMDAGKAEEGAGASDLTSATLSGWSRDNALGEKRASTFGRMRSRTAASGVEMSGSALEVLQHSAEQAERDLIVSRRITQGALEAARARMRGGSAAVSGAAASGAFRLGAIGLKAKQERDAGVKPETVQEESWMKQYGND